MARDLYYVYPEDRNEKKTGHCICIIVRDGSAFHGIALCSPEDQFNKKEGRILAYTRAIDSYNRWKIKQDMKKVKV
jgi:hypothetical protein